ncbi:hypothetical protein CMI37_27670 [Candidatus Pacearchaeota archaeon]|nr:hypothetical protein [Candidatus Pacearchaeota archaeon]|tara:strand:- start:106 stop:951 length:846 start_codon:yes stop_codon:yes gene_type:complete
MGLGGYLTWTAVMREISHKKLDNDTKILPCEIRDGNITRIFTSPIFDNNPYIYNERRDKGKRTFALPLSLHETSYCKKDTPTKAYQRYDKHIISQITEYYGIDDPELKCELYFSDQEEEESKNIIQELTKGYVVIEPNSKQDYTPNRKYPFEKWQKVVDSLSGEVDFVQVGAPGTPALRGVHSLVGKVSFRQAALVIRSARLFVSTEGGLSHAANAVGTKSVIVLTGYQGYDMVAYPDNINISIATHGPCGLKIECLDCKKDAANHDCNEIINNIRKHLEL